MAFAPPAGQVPGLIDKQGFQHRAFGRDVAIVVRASTADDSFKQCKRCGQASKGVRWMPWRRTAMKDVVSCDKLR